MRLLIDTSAYSAFKREVESIVAEVQTADEIHVSSIVLGELRSGFDHGNVPERNERELRELLRSPRVRTVGVGDETSVYYAKIFASLRKAGTPIPTNDLCIAAAAMQHGLIVLTRDEHFGLVPQIVVRGLD